jgi:hypothetical protein
MKIFFCYPFQHKFWFFIAIEFVPCVFEHFVLISLQLLEVIMHKKKFSELWWILNQWSLNSWGFTVIFSSNVLHNTILKHTHSTHLQLVPRLRKRGSIHPLPHTSSWRSA